jgi:hypothetical protein
VLAQPLDVRDQVLGRVLTQVDVGLARVRRAPAAVPLVEEHDAIALEVEHLGVPNGAARTRAAMEHDRRLAFRVAPRLPPDEVAMFDIQVTGGVHHGARV